MAIYRQELLMVLAQSAHLLWRRLQGRNVQRIDGKRNTPRIRSNVIGEG